MPDLNSILNTSVGSISVGSAVSAIITLLICLLVIKIILKVVTRLLGKTKLDARITKYVTTGVKLVLYVISALIVVDSLGIPITSLVALLSVFSLGITLAVEDIIANVAGGLVILSAHPFNIGDFVEAAGISGTVQEISLNYTKLITPDGQLVLVPNKELADSKMTNYTVLGTRRVCQKVTASYDAPTETVKAACQKALEMTDKVLADPASAIRLTGYGESSIEYAVYCWSSAEDYWDVHFALGENLRTAFAEFGVEMTYNHLNVHIMDKGN